MSDPKSEAESKSNLSTNDDTRTAGQNTVCQARSRSEIKQIGPYRVLHTIGEGGMGTVFLAEQVSPIRRMVALKLIRSGKGTSRFIKRFEAERQALAMMDHQNIARVFDAGCSEDDLPYFAMEYVKGIPLTEYCNKKSLSVKERIALFVPVCLAVQHAHQKGIVHRDLKPNNILVAEYDNQPTPKVIDFGLAKACQDDSFVEFKMDSTEFGVVAGTLQYMSPEQAELDSLDIDTRTDIYSLGVVLYELLTGLTPLGKNCTEEQGLLDILDDIRNLEPEKPSSRISSLGGEGNVPEPAEVNKLQRELRGELDWIVLKAVEKDRARRFQTANALARDLTRYLNNEPVEARPASVGYRLQKAYVRNKTAFGSAAIVFATLVLAFCLLGVSWWNERQSASESAELAKNAEAQRQEAETQRREAERQRKEAERQREKAFREAENQKATTDFLFSFFGAGDPVFSVALSDYSNTPTGKMTVEELMRRVIDVEADDRLTTLGERSVLRARVLIGLGDFGVSNGDLPLATLSLEKGLELLEGSEEHQADKAKALVTLGFLHCTRGEMDEGEQSVKQAVRCLMEAQLDSPHDPDLFHEIQDCNLILGSIYAEREDFALARQHFRLASRSAAPGNVAPTKAGKIRALAGNAFELTSEMNRRQLYDLPAYDLVPRFVFLALAAYRQRDLVTDSVAESLWISLWGQFKYALGFKRANFEALETVLSLQRTRLGERHYLNCLPLYYLVKSAHEIEQYEAALEYSNQLLELVDLQVKKRGHPKLSEIFDLRAQILLRQSQARTEDRDPLLDQSLENVDEALRIATNFYGDKSLHVARSLRVRSQIYARMGRHQAASDDLELAYALHVAVLGNEHPRSKATLEEFKRSWDE